MAPSRWAPSSWIPSGWSPSSWFRSGPTELAIPASAKSDPKATEILRVWSANGGHHVSMQAEPWEDVGAWGIMLADLARHVADTYHEDEGMDRNQALRRILTFLVRELASSANRADR